VDSGFRLCVCFEEQNKTQAHVEYEKENGEKPKRGNGIQKEFEEGKKRN